MSRRSGYRYICDDGAVFSMEELNHQWRVRGDGAQVSGRYGMMLWEGMFSRWDCWDDCTDMGCRYILYGSLRFPTNPLNTCSRLDYVPIAWVTDLVCIKVARPQSYIT